MASTYPTTLDSFTNPAGTSVVTSPDHALQHSDANDAIENIETVLGTTSGTAILKNITTGKFAIAGEGETINNMTIGTPRITGGTASSFLLGTSTIQGGTANNITVGTPTIAGATITSGTINNATLGSPAVTGGTANAFNLGTPVITGGVSLATNGSITQTSTADHITLTPGASKLVRVATRYQSGTTNSYQNNVVIQHGWGYIEGAGATPSILVKAVTFPDAFSTLLSLTCTGIGFKNSSGAPTAIADFVTNPGIELVGSGLIPSVTGFTAQVNAVGGAINADRWVGFSWIAIGIL